MNKSAKLKMQNNKTKTDIIERSYLFALKTIKLVDSMHNDQASKIISEQLLRSATSIGANIIEAQAASSRKDFTNFLNHALKSANETKFWLGLLCDSRKGDKEEISSLLEDTKQLANILGTSILTLKRS